MNAKVLVSNPADLGRLIREDQDRLQMDVKYGIIAAAQIGQRVVRSVEPVDTGRLRRETIVREFPNGFAASVVAEIAITSPYAAAQEVGTRPFTPPFQAILAWAMRQAPNLGLGGAQRAARAAEGDIRRAIRAARRADRVGARASVRGGYSFDRDVARHALDRKIQANKEIEAFARRVWASIRKNGIKAKWFMRGAQPKLRVVLGRCVTKAVREHVPAGVR